VSDSPPERGPLVLLDGMSLAFRAFFALPDDLSTSAGVVTNAVHGFTAMLVNLVRDHHPSALAVAFDLPGGTFRDEMVEDYKGGRDETPDILLPQFDMIRDIVRALAIPVAEVPDYEADDVLATLATEARDSGNDVIVVTGDRDCFQLVEDPHVRVLYNRRGVSDYALYDEAGIVERTGVTPDKYPALASLRGDKSDNLPGVPGVGEKTAAKLLNTYGDLDGIFAHLDELTPKLRENLAANEALARSNLTVIPLVRDVPLPFTADELALGGWDRDEVEGVFATLELRTQWRRVSTLLDEGQLGTARAAARQASAAKGRARSTPAEPSGPVTDPAPAPADDPALVEVALEVSRPATATAAAAAVRDLRKAGDAADRGPGAGVLAVAGRWSGEPGRSPLLGVLVAATAAGQGVWLAAPLLTSTSVVTALDRAWGAGGLVGHHVKEVFRSLLPLGEACEGLAMDTAVAAYLLDPSSGDYALAAVAGPAAVAAAGGAGDAPDPSETGAPPDAAPARARRKPAAAQLALDDGTPDGDASAVAVDPVPSAAAEAATVAQLVEPFRARLAAEELLALHDEVETPLVRVLARMEVVGIRVDTAELRRITDALVGECRRLEVEIQEIAGHEFKVNSTPQLRTVLYDELGLTPGRKTKTGFSTDAATLETLRDAHPIVDKLLRYREVEKLRSTYGESLLQEVADDGRIHASFRQTVARTGRLSSDRPNLHNIPVRTEEGRTFRRAFVPAEGSRFCVADYDQIELRVLAHLSGDPGLIEAFTSGTDVHRAVAAGVFSVPPEEVTHTQRERAKMVSYGLAYGMEAFGLARRLATSVEEANEIMGRYFTAFPEVRDYMEATVAEARARGYTRTALGRKRPLPELHDRNYRVRQAAERQAMNAGIQGLAADLFKTALVRLDAALTDAGLTSRLVLQVHDEVIVEAAAAEEEPVAALTEASLTGAADLRVPLKVSMAWGSSWAEAKGG
jgi:DNA polymerase-1